MCLLVLYVIKVSICLVCDFSIVTTCPSIQLPTLLFVCVLFVLFLLFVVVFFGKPKQKQGRGLVDHILVQVPPVISLLAVPRRLFCFGSLVILDVARCYLSSLADDHLCGKLLFTWLSLVVSMLVSFCAVLFPTRCLG